MKRVILVTAGMIFLLLCSSCRKEHVAPVNQLVKDLFCFQTGSEWTYYDSVSQTTQKITVTKNETTRIGSKYAMRQTYDWAEIIEMCVTIENTVQSLFISKVTSLESDEEQDNTLRQEVSQIFTPSGEYLRIGCDKNNKFTPSATYLNAHIINKTIYSDVYVFNSKDNISYYVSQKQRAGICNYHL